MSVSTEKDLGSIDLAGPALWDAGPPYDLFARMQRERLWIQQTIERFPDLALDGEPMRVRALFLNQYNSILVR